MSGGGLLQCAPQHLPLPSPPLRSPPYHSQNSMEAGPLAHPLVTKLANWARPICLHLDYTLKTLPIYISVQES